MGKLLLLTDMTLLAFNLSFQEDGSEIKLIWKNPELEPHHGGMVLLGDYIYSSNHMSNSMGEWLCVNWNTGETNVERALVQ